MKFVNLETGKSTFSIVSKKGFAVRHKYGLRPDKVICIRAYSIVMDDLCAVFDDYTVVLAAGFFFLSLETGEKFLLMRD